MTFVRLYSSKCFKMLFTLLIVSACAISVRAYDNGMYDNFIQHMASMIVLLGIPSPTPPMGWNTWCTLGRLRHF